MTLVEKITELTQGIRSEFNSVKASILSQSQSILSLQNATTQLQNSLLSVSALVGGNISSIANIEAALSSLSSIVQNLVNTHPPYRSGSYVHAAVTSIVPATQVSTAGQLRAYPILIKRTVTFTEMRFETVTPATISLARFGIYSDSGQLYPANLVPDSDTGDINTSTAGLKTLVFSSPITLSPGVYWITFLTNANATFRSIPVQAALNLLGSLANIGNVACLTGWSFGLAYQDLPSVYPANAGLLNNNQPPWVTLRVQ
jgi:hypothetical protein